MATAATVAVLVTSGWSAYFTADRELAAQQPSTVSRMQQAGPTLGRVRLDSAVRSFSRPNLELEDIDLLSAQTRAVVAPLIGVEFEVETADGYLDGTTRRSRTLLANPAWETRLHRLANVGYVIQDLTPSVPGDASVLLRNSALGFELLEVPAEPRASVRVPLCVDGPEQSLAVVLSADFDPSKYAVVEGCKADRRGPGGKNGSVRITRYEPQAVDLEVSAPEGGVLVLSDAFARGWTAEVDGTAVSILPTNHAFRGVMVRPESRVVTFRYTAPGLLPGAVISGLSLLVGVGVALTRRRKDRLG